MIKDQHKRHDTLVLLWLQSHTILKSNKKLIEYNRYFDRGSEYS